MTRTRRAALAVAAAVPGGTVRPAGNGRWRASLPASVLTVTITSAGNDSLRCSLPSPASPSLTLAFAPWPAATVLNCPLPALPTSGRLSARDVRVTTRMGRTIRFLIPEFTTT